VGLPPVYPPPPRHILVERSGAYLALLALVALTTLFVKRLLLSAGRRLLAAYRDLTADSPPPRPPQPAAPVPDSGAERGAEALDAEPALALEGNAERSARQRYLSLLWGATTLVALYAGDLLSNFTALRP